MHRKIKIVLNPMADMGNAWRVARDLRSMTKEHGGVDWSGTVYPGHAIELAKQAGYDGYDMVVAMGGDGTVHEVMNGLMQVPEEKRPILGVVPVGSGNDFGHGIHASQTPTVALQRALHGEASTVDLGLMTDEKGRTEYFDNTLGIGFGAIVTLEIAGEGGRPSRDIVLPLSRIAAKDADAQMFRKIGVVAPASRAI